MPHNVQVPEYLWFLNTLVRIRVAHARGTDGISVIESLAAYADSPPLHIHHTEDELFHILEGEFRFLAGGRELRAGPGQTILTHKGVPHTYRVESKTGGRWLVVTTHGDFERFVREMSRPAPGAQLPPPSGPTTSQEAQAIGAVAIRHHIEMVGPALS